MKGLLQWLSVKESACNAGDTGEEALISGSGKSPGGGNGKPHALVKSLALPTVVTINTNITAKWRNMVLMPTMLGRLNQLERLQTLNSCSPKSPFSVLRLQTGTTTQSQGQVGIMGGNC